MAEPVPITELSAFSSPNATQRGGSRCDSPICCRPREHLGQRSQLVGLSAHFAEVERLMISPSAHLAAEEGGDSVRRWAVVAARLLIAEWPTITAEPRVAHHLL
jgi:hypothetical protein